MSAITNADYNRLVAMLFGFNRKGFNMDDDSLAAYFRALLEVMDTRGPLSDRDKQFVGRMVSQSLQKYGKPPRVKRLGELLDEYRELRLVEEAL